MHFGDDKAARLLARQVNEYTTALTRDHPGRFGNFVSLPLPDVDGSLEEIGFAFDELDADGVALLTHTHGVYLGDQRLDPVFAELDRRRAVVFLHPTSPVCWEQSALGRPRPMVEYIFGRRQPSPTGTLRSGLGSGRFSPPWDGRGRDRRRRSRPGCGHGRRSWPGHDRHAS
ncbi:amidohydrolase family protein [Streptomyces sp. NBC_00289]|uniref:amidohydrolase family protein n=1 Tax=Streptomyces sp. NBC_00289 TaxID=2975703 RepID=UPI00352F1FBB